MASMTANTPHKATNTLHNQALITAYNRQTIHASAIVNMLTAWQAYATAHKAKYGDPIGYDCYIGPAWLAIGSGIHTLLSGELEALDNGTLDRFMRDAVRENGFSEDDAQQI